MKIVLAASEAVPFCKTGGLADVVGAMTSKLGAAGHDVCLFLPKYRAARLEGFEGKPQPLAVKLGGATVDTFLWFAQRRGASVCLIDHPPSFDRDGLYGAAGADHPDNDKRFALFSRAVLEALKKLGFKPDVVHAHDWQTGLIPALLATTYKDDPFFAATATVFTTHNMAYQGNFPRASLAVTGLPESAFTPEGVEYYGQVGYLKAGLAYARRLTTVSPTYAREIQESGERGFGMEGLLRGRSAALTGVLNGLDLDIWSPERDAHLPRKYGVEDRVAGKAACKKAALSDAGLPADDGKPLIGVISRLDPQKGLDLAIAAVEPRLGRCRLAVIGTGDPALERDFVSLSERRSAEVSFRRAFDEPSAHRLYAGCDLFLMPSRFEPCGLGQLIAMRYGAVPVASRTGGLADTVFESGTRPNGFSCAPGDAADLGRALDRALDACERRELGARADAAMNLDVSWERSIALYLEVYRAAKAVPA